MSLVLLACWGSPPASSARAAGDAERKPGSHAASSSPASSKPDHDAKPCKSIRPGPWKAIGMMLAAGGDERRRNAGPVLPERSESERLSRASDFWARGVRPAGFDDRGVPAYVRLADGARIVLVPGGDAELGVPDRLRDEVPPVVVLTTCPAHVIRLAEGVPMRDDMVLRAPYPAQRVSLRPFAIDTTEVTWAQYRKYQQRVLGRARPRPEKWAGDDHPVTGVTWYEAAGYCDWVGGRLPTDAEWEHAARGPLGVAYPWGDEWPPPDAVGNFSDASLAAALCEPVEGLPDDSFVYMSPVGSFPNGASPFGVLDMLGNAAEWVSDWADDVDLTVRPVAQPCPPERKDLRDKVQRGSSFFESSVLREEARGAWERSGDFPWTRDPLCGFRCAHDGPPEGSAPTTPRPEPPR